MSVPAAGAASLQAGSSSLLTASDAGTGGAGARRVSATAAAANTSAWNAPVPMGEVYPAYRERSDDPASRSTVRRELAKLERDDIVAIDGQSRETTYRLLEE